MTPNGWITLALLAIAMLLLITDRLRPDLTALLLALVLAVTGVLSPEQAFSGFGQSAVITILSIFIITEGLARTGVTAWAGRQIIRLAGTTERRLVAGLSLTSAVLSLFMNTIAATAVLLTPGVGIARQAKLRPSRLLMPIAFGSLLGGTATLLTTAHLIVSSALEQAGFDSFGLLDFLPVGGPVALGGIVLLIVLSPHLLPQKDVVGQLVRMRRLRKELIDIYHLQQDAAEMIVGSGSPLAGHTLEEAGWGKDMDVTVLGIQHNGNLILGPDRNAIVEAGDHVLLSRGLEDAEMENYHLTSENQLDLLEEFRAQDYVLMEAVLTPRSTWAGKTLREIQLRQRYQFQVLAVWREGKILQTDIAGRALRLGDALLLQGPRESLALLKTDPNLLLLEHQMERVDTRRAVYAVGITILALVLAGLQLLPIAVATLLGAVGMVLTGCLTMDEAYRAVDWKSIFLIAGMLSVSVALDVTGAAQALAEGLYFVSGGLPPLAIAAIFLVLAAALGLFLSGQASAVILAPIAIAAAIPSGADPRTLAMATAIGCSLTFISPLGHPANLLVMGPGGYTFRDYFRLGLPLTILTIGIALLSLHYFMGL